MHGRVHRADFLARRLLAVHAGQRLRDDSRFLDAAREIAVDANPVQFAVALHLLFADHGDVVFGLTCDEAGRTSRAGVEVDHHAPLDLRVEQFGTGEVEVEAFLFFANRTARLLRVAVATLETLAFLRCLARLWLAASRAFA